MRLGRRGSALAVGILVLHILPNPLGIGLEPMSDLAHLSALGTGQLGNLFEFLGKPLIILHIFRSDGG